MGLSRDMHTGTWIFRVYFFSKACPIMACNTNWATWADIGDQNDWLMWSRFWMVVLKVLRFVTLQGRLSKGLQSLLNLHGLGCRKTWQRGNLLKFGIWTLLCRVQHLWSCILLKQFNHGWYLTQNIIGCTRQLLFALNASTLRFSSAISVSLEENTRGEQRKGTSAFKDRELYPNYIQSWRKIETFLKVVVW